MKLLPPQISHNFILPANIIFFAAVQCTMRTKMENHKKKRKTGTIKSYIGTLSVVTAAAVLIIISTLFFSTNTKDTADETTQSLSRFYLEEIAERTVYEIDNVLENSSTQLHRAVDEMSNESFNSVDELRSYLDMIQHLNGLDIFAVVDENGMVYTRDNTFSGISRFGFLSEPITETRLFTTTTYKSNAMILISMPTMPFSVGTADIVSCITGVDVDNIISAQQLQGVNNQVVCRLFNGDDGTCVVESEDKYSEGKSIFDVWKNTCSFSDEYPYEQLVTDWTEHVEGYSSYMSGEGTTYLYYKPVPNTNWMVSVRLRESVISTRISQTSRQVFYSSLIQLIVVIVSMLFVLFFAIRQVRKNQRMLFEKENEERQQKILKDALAQAKSANQAKTTFLNNMSHDIRTPMNAIIGFTNIALKQDINSEVRRCLEKISDSSDHLLTLINDVLDISRIESGKTIYNPVPTEITSITDSVLAVMNGFLANRSITFNVRREPPKNPYVLADAVRVREILVNILSNAVKFTEDGGTITFDAIALPASDEQHVIAHYEISDTGIGMNKEFLKHIYDEFVQEDSSARTQYKGTGLGMAITKRYVELMNGSINVESQKGVGTIFTVDIPLEFTDDPHPQVAKPLDAYADLKGTKILLVEDNDLNAEIATVQLEDYGFVITRASNGEEALELFTENPPKTFDIILMDIMMPVMDGYDATKAIRSIYGRPDGQYIPIIAMTANAFAEDIQKSIDAGMNAHLAKPINMSDVLQTISRCMNLTNP